MLYHLLLPLSDTFILFNLFRYITFRTAGATVTALLIGLILGPIVIRKLKERQVAEKIREEGPASHKVKAGTPTMGGIIVLFSVVIPTLLWADLTNAYTQLILLVTVWMGLIGFMDDYLKAIKHQPKGMVGKKKLAGQVALGLLLGILLRLCPPSENFGTASDILFFKNHLVNFGAFYIPLVILVITGASNAVNLTDGLDGLAIGLIGLCAFRRSVLHDRPGGFHRLPLHNISGGRGRTDHLLRSRGGGGLGIFVVQRSSGGSLHGRYRSSGHGGSIRRHIHTDKEGDAASDSWWGLRGRSALGDPPGIQLSGLGKEDLQDGTLASSFRTFRMEGAPGGGAVLDSRSHIGALNLDHFEDKVRLVWKRRLKACGYQF